ncbi:complement C1q-like protein 4 [Liolophura sinensis]|uniref:complement C1q-like protein 4 n=1 Tax=Liolophura sinensis TaxID=3198878 RepID=UPI003158B05F
MGSYFLLPAVLAFLALTPICYLTASATTVAFSVGKSSNQVVHGLAVITFDREFVNEGNAFDLLTSTFTCPQDGVYAFHLHGLSGGTHRRFLAGIYHNNDLMVTAYAKVREFWSMGGNTVLLSLRVGDAVQVKFVYGQNELYGDNTELYTTFSGYLLSSS